METIGFMHMLKVEFVYDLTLTEKDHRTYLMLICILPNPCGNIASSRYDL